VTTDTEVSQRCFGDGDPLYAVYHDTEWGVPVHGEAALLERLILEGFQAGLSWLLVLRRRSAFQEVFEGFDPARVAAFTDDDVARLAADRRIIRNERKIRSAIANAQAVEALHATGRSLDDLIWSFAPRTVNRPSDWADVPATTPQAEALAAALKASGFRGIGPVTAYATMQACGLVNDHLVGCPTGDGLDARQRIRPETPVRNS
jgi:DNA-3-methyladenine glycosylase I